MIGLMTVGLAKGGRELLPGLSGGLHIRITTLGGDCVAIMVVDGPGDLIAEAVEEHGGATDLAQIGDRDDLPVPVLEPTARHRFTGL